VSIPVGAIVELEGAVAKSGLVNVHWNDEVFSVFYEDIAKARS
jgi:hypothetical protein